MEHNALEEYYKQFGGLKIGQLWRPNFSSTDCPKNRHFLQNILPWKCDPYWAFKKQTKNKNKKIKQNKNSAIDGTDNSLARATELCG